MSLTLKPATPRHVRNLRQRIFTIRGILIVLRLCFVSGPISLFTSPLSYKHAVIMMLLCAPGVILASLMTLPQYLFSSPEQQAYYEFARILNQDPTRLIVLALAALCTLVALAIPATVPKPLTAVRF